MTDDIKKTTEDAAAEAKKAAEQQLIDEGKALTAKGFSKEQVAQQLSSKHAITVAEVDALLSRDDADNKGDQKNK